MRFNSSAARTLFRQSKSPQLDRWAEAAGHLGVDPDWLHKGIGDPPPRVAERLAWLLSDPDLPPHARRAPVQFSRNLALVQDAERDLDSAGLPPISEGSDHDAIDQRHPADLDAHRAPRS